MCNIVGPQAPFRFPGPGNLSRRHWRAVSVWCGCRTVVYMCTLEIPVMALAKARPDSDPCGGPLKVIVKRKNKSKFLIY
jgi:hypothetical protein